MENQIYSWSFSISFLSKTRLKVKKLKLIFSNFYKILVGLFVVKKIIRGYLAIICISMLSLIIIHWRQWQWRGKRTRMIGRVFIVNAFSADKHRLVAPRDNTQLLSWYTRITTCMGGTMVVSTNRARCRGALPPYTWPHERLLRHYRGSDPAGAK